MARNQSAVEAPFESPREFSKNIGFKLRVLLQMALTAEGCLQYQCLELCESPSNCSDPELPSLKFRRRRASWDDSKMRGTAVVMSAYGNAGVIWLSIENRDVIWIVVFHTVRTAQKAARLFLNSLLNEEQSAWCHAEVDSGVDNSSPWDA